VRDVSFCLNLKSSFSFVQKKKRKKERKKRKKKLLVS